MAAWAFFSLTKVGGPTVIHEKNGIPKKNGIPNNISDVYKSQRSINRKQLKEVQQNNRESYGMVHQELYWWDDVVGKCQIEQRQKTIRTTKQVHL